MDAGIGDLIARGDRKGAATLLVQHAPAVFALCRAMVRDRQLAEDLSQDAFAKAFAALEGFRGEASARTWLLKIARNRCLDHLERARQAPWGRDPDPDPDDHAADEPPPIRLLARREDAERAIAVLGENERALIVLHFGHGVDYAELADSFGIARGAVRMRVSRALARMREVLRDADDAVVRETDELAVTGRHGVIQRVAEEAPAGLDLEDDATFAEDSSAFGEVETEIDEGPTTIRDTPPLVHVHAVVAPIPTLHDELPDALRDRLRSLASSL